MPFVSLNNQPTTYVVFCPIPPNKQANKQTNQSFFGALGCAFSIIFTVIGSSYGTAKSSGAIFSCGVIRPDRLMQNTLRTWPFLTYLPT
jgi:hypothetical protein